MLLLQECLLCIAGENKVNGSPQETSYVKSSRNKWMPELGVLPKYRHGLRLRNADLPSEQKSLEKGQCILKIIPDIADEGGYNARVAAKEQTDQ